MGKLTSRSFASGVTVDDLVHIVITGDTSQDPDGSSYKASIKQVFDAITGYCISDLYVTNIHSCSPLHINPLDEGNVYFGSTSGVTIDIDSGGNIMNLGNINLQSDNSIDPYTIVSGFTDARYKGFFVHFDNAGINTVEVANNNTNGSSVVKSQSTLSSNKYISIDYYGDNYVRDGSPSSGTLFYQNRGRLAIGKESDGMIINISQTGNTGNLWFEQNGNIIMYVKGGPNPYDGSLGLMLNPDGTEEPTANLQVGGTGTTGTAKIIGTLSADTMVITTSYTPTGTADANGEPGTITWDDDNLYYKTNNGWFKLSGVTF